jgi:choline-sulfatase
MLYDDQLHVPLIMWGKGIEPGTSDALMSHLDLAPTLCQLAGARPAPEFRGLPLADRLARPAKHLIAENTGRGRCDISAKPIYTCIRSNDFKVVYQASDYQACERDVFDLAKDPKEEHNLVESDDGAEARAQLRRVAERRLQQLKLENGVAQRQTVTPANW